MRTSAMLPDGARRNGGTPDYAEPLGTASQNAIPDDVRAADLDDETAGMRLDEELDRLGCSPPWLAPRGACSRQGG